MKHLIIVFFSLLISQVLLAQTKIVGTVKDGQNKPVYGATIKIKSTKNKQITKQTNKHGEFSIKASEGDTIDVIANKIILNTMIVTGEMFKKRIEIKLSHSLEQENFVAGGSQSPNSFWIGAKIGYNFDGFSEEDLDNYFVGAAKVVLNKYSLPFLKGECGVVGNIANFISNQNKEDAEKDKEKIALSVQGLGVGLYQLWENGNKEKKTFFRKYLTAGYRLNTFKNVGIDSSTVNISQFRLTGGLEFEALTFEKGGALNLSCEVSHSRFSENRYESVFGEKKNSLTSIEFGVILPINENLGFFSSGTFAAGMKPVYLFGVVVKADSKND